MHALFSPSSSARWLSCKASLDTEHLPEEESSYHAERGTRAHLYFEALMKGEPFDTSLLDSGDPESVEAAYSYVCGLKTPGCHIFAEQTLFDPWVSAHVFGTLDAAIVDEEQDVVHILDYKNGGGVAVSPIYNSQLMTYACLFQRVYPQWEYFQYELHVLQPKRDIMAGHRIHPQDLVEHWEKIKQCVRDYHTDESLRKIKNPGEWCKFCPRLYKDCVGNI